MRKALAYTLMAAMAGGLLSAAERKSWNKIRYVGGTNSIKAGAYDWDTTVTIRSNPDTLELVVAPAAPFEHPQTLSLRVSQITAVVNGRGAWQRVAAVPGSQLPREPHGLFGLLNRGSPIFGGPYSFLAILYEGDDGKAAAILLDCDPAGRTDTTLGRSLAALTGKPVIYAK